MFDIFSWQHICIMLVVALVVVGPKDLPRLMHMAGKWAGKARTMAGEFRKSFDDMARETELSELRKEIEALKQNNPMSDVVNAVSDAQASVGNPLAGPGISAAQETAAAPRSGEFEVTSSPVSPAASNGPAVS